MTIRHRPSPRAWVIGFPLALAMLGLFVAGRGRADAEQQPPAPSVTAEDRLEAREDVELLEAYVKAKQAQVRHAELRVKLLQTYRDDARAKRAKGYLLATAVAEREMQLAEGETELAFRAAELKDFQVRLERARRRLAALPPAE